MRADSKRDADYSARNASFFLVMMMHAAIRLPQLHRHRSHRPLSDRVVLAALGVYRRHLTKHTPNCAQNPSCSTYAVATVEDYGWRKGLSMTLKRMGPCL